MGKELCLKPKINTTIGISFALYEKPSGQNKRRKERKGGGSGVRILRGFRGSYTNAREMTQLPHSKSWRVNEKKTLRNAQHKVMRLQCLLPLYSRWRVSQGIFS